MLSRPRNLDFDSAQSCCFARVLYGSYNRTCRVLSSKSTHISPRCRSDRRSIRSPQRHKRCMSTGKTKTRKTAGRNSSLRFQVVGPTPRRASPATVPKHGVNARDPWGHSGFCVTFSLSRSNQQQLLVAACNASFFERFENGLDLQSWPERPTAAEYGEPKGFSLARTCLARQKREGIPASRCIFRRYSWPCFLLVIVT
jgi:hypothetical protein